MARVQNVNTTDLADAIRLGCRTMTRVFDADDDHRPFFSSEIRPDTRLAFNPAHSEAHVPGRHLNALLNAEDALGLRIPESAIENHARAAFFSYSGPVPVPLNREKKDGPLINFVPHNVREGFHALYALVNYRDDARARRVSEESIEFIFRHWDPAAGWDRAYFENRGIRLVEGELATFITGLARAIGPLVKYHRATGHARALELARRLQEKVTGEFFRPDGGYDARRFGAHTHSTTCVMSGLAQLADCLGDRALLERVRAFYDTGLWQIRDQLGWVIENWNRQGPEADVGEVNNTGDIVETALILGRHGFAGYYDDAERILRGHLLPAQLRDTSFIHDPPNPNNEDGRRDVADRHLGAFGFPAPYGHQAAGTNWLSFNMDIVGGAVGSLCDAWRETTRFDHDGPDGRGQHRVNLLFDRETPATRVESDQAGGALRVTLKRPGELSVRLPAWLARERLRIGGREGPPRFAAGQLLVSDQPVGRALELRYELPVHEIELAHRAHVIRARLRGDAVLAMDNFGADLTFFDPYE